MSGCRKSSLNSSKLNPGKKVSIAVAAIPFCHGLTCDRCGRDFNVPVSDKLEYFADPTKPVHCFRCLYTSILERDAKVHTYRLTGGPDKPAGIRGWFGGS